MPDVKDTETAKAQAQLITSVTGIAGLILAFTTLNTDRSYRLLVLALGAAGFLLAFGALKSPRTRLWGSRAGLALMICAAVLLALAPVGEPVAKPRVSPQPTPKANVRGSQLLLTPAHGKKRSTVDVTVHNVGEMRAVLTKLRLTITDIGPNAGCPQLMPVISPKGQYPLSLSSDPAVGQTVKADLHEEVGPDGVVRIQAPISLPRSLAPTFDGYALTARVVLETDSDRPVELGNVKSCLDNLSVVLPKRPH